MSLNIPHAVTSKELYSKMAMISVAQTSPKRVRFFVQNDGGWMSKKSFYSPKLPERNMRVRASKLMHWSAKSGWFWMSLIVPGGNPKKAFVQGILLKAFEPWRSHKSICENMAKKRAETGDEHLASPAARRLRSKIIQVLASSLPWISSPWLLEVIQLNGPWWAMASMANS